MFFHRQYLAGKLWLKLLKLWYELCVKVLCHLIKAVPLGKVRPHHRQAVPCPPPLMMP